MTTTRFFDGRTRRHCLSAMLAACATVSMGLLAQPASAEDYPTRPVRVITPFAPGSGPNSVIRLVGEKLTQVWGQQVVVDNRPGGNGFIAIGAAKKADPDGYTLVQVDDTHMALQPHLYKKIPYDIATDFDPIGTLFRVNFFVVVPSNSPWKTMGDLIDTARKEPGYVTYGSWFTGSPGHLGAAMLEAATGTQMVHVPYKQASDLYIGVGNGDVNWAFGSAGSAGAMYRAGKVKYLAVAAPERSSGYPDVPTVQGGGRSRRPRSEGLGCSPGPARDTPRHHREDQPGPEADPGPARDPRALHRLWLRALRLDTRRGHEDAGGRPEALRRHRGPDEYLDPVTGVRAVELTHQWRMP